VHPIERLRYVARAASSGSGMLLGEAAGALAGFTSDPAALVTACRRLVDRQPTYGPMWWLAATVLCAQDPDEAAWSSARAFDRDPTPSFVTEELPSSATVTVIGWPEQAALALRRRGDLMLFVVGGDPHRVGRAFESYDVDGEVVDPMAMAAAVAASDLLLLEARAGGPDDVLTAAGSLPAALVARHHGVPVWLVAGRGRILPPRMWHALTARLPEEQPWHRDEEIVPCQLVDVALTPDGRTERPIHLVGDCPVAPELLRETG
jgi:hypothetical protein